MNDELMNVIIFGFVLVVIVAVLLITPPRTRLPSKPPSLAGKH